MENTHSWVVPSITVSIDLALEARFLDNKLAQLLKFIDFSVLHCSSVVIYSSRFRDVLVSS